MPVSPSTRSCFMTQWGDARREAADRDRRHAVRLVRGVGRARRCTTAVRLVKEGGADRGQARARRGPRSRAPARSSGAGIPVMGHVGLTPQTATVLGGFKAQGRTAERARQLIKDAHSSASRRRAASRSCSRPCLRQSRGEPTQAGSAVPTIGIGAGADTDGQVLVWHDMLGFFRRAGATLRQALRRGRGRPIVEALEALRRGEVRSRRLPRGAPHVRHARGRASGVRGRAESQVTDCY